MAVLKELKTLLNRKSNPRAEDKRFPVRSVIDFVSCWTRCWMCPKFDRRLILTFSSQKETLSSLETNDLINFNKVGEITSGEIPRRRTYQCDVYSPGLSRSFRILCLPIPPRHEHNPKHQKNEQSRKERASCWARA